MSETLLEVRNLKKYFPVRGGLFQRRIGHIEAVDGIDLSIEQRQSFGLVGESGSGFRSSRAPLGGTLVPHHSRSDCIFDRKERYAYSNQS